MCKSSYSNQCQQNKRKDLLRFVNTNRLISLLQILSTVILHALTRIICHYSERFVNRFWRCIVNTIDYDFVKGLCQQY